MALAGPSDPTSPKPRVDVVVGALIRMIVTTKDVYRDSLLDALYVYRRRAGAVFGIDPPVRHRSKVPITNQAPRPIFITGAGPPRGKKRVVRPSRAQP